MGGCVRSLFLLGTLALFGALLTGCTTAQMARAVLPYPPQTLDPDPLQPYCENEMGLFVEKTVPGVDGFLYLAFFDEDAGPSLIETAGGGCSFNCIEWLADDGFAFVEAPFNEDAGSFSTELALENGLYRYQLLRRPDPRCERFDSLVGLERGGWWWRATERADVFDDHCLAALPVERFRARYEYRRASTLVARPETRGKEGYILRSDVTIRDRESGEVLARKTGFSHLNNHFTGRQIGNCHLPGNLIVSDVLKPS